MTLSGHSLDYGVQKVCVPKTSGFGIGRTANASALKHMWVSGTPEPFHIPSFGSFSRLHGQEDGPVLDPANSNFKTAPSPPIRKK